MVGKLVIISNEEETYDEICNFVTKNRGCTINEVVDYIINVKKMCAKQTAQNRVVDLIGNRLVDERKGGPKAFHHLYINNDDKFNLLTKRIDRLLEYTKMFNNFIDKNALDSKNSEGTDADTDVLFPNLIRMGQLHIYTSATMLARAISIVKPLENREILYLRLVKILVAFGRMNDIISNTITTDLEEYVGKLQDKKVQQKDLPEHTLILNFAKELLEQARLLNKKIRS